MLPECLRFPLSSIALHRAPSIYRSSIRLDLRRASFLGHRAPTPRLQAQIRPATLPDPIMAPPPALQTQYMSSTSKPKKLPQEPRPSASILLISPTNEILLLHRVRTSNSFPSAHVFPGGNLSPTQDGVIPGPSDPNRHIDGPIYRIGAVRECFEESGILLARKKDGSGDMLTVDAAERERARRAIHSGKLKFTDWVDGLGGTIDTASLLPFTRWVTPANVPRRFTTQMYIAFLDLPKSASPSTSASATPSSTLPTDAVIPVPTSDGGIEHTEALFAPISTWLARAKANDIILFPPQMFLMYQLSAFLPAPPSSTPFSVSELQAQRERVLEFLARDADAKGTRWADKVISPTGIMMLKGDGRSVLGLDKPGPELSGQGRRGDDRWVVLVRFSKEGPRDVEVRERAAVLEEERAATREGKL